MPDHRHLISLAQFAEAFKRAKDLPVDCIIVQHVAQERMRVELVQTILKLLPKLAENGIVQLNYVLKVFMLLSDLK